MKKNPLLLSPENLPRPVQLVAAILYRLDEDLDHCLEQLAGCWSPVDFRSRAFLFSATDYYQEEMGDRLYRVLVGFSHLVPPEKLAGIKWEATEVERRFASDGRRAVNIDPGYLDEFKLVLASFKERGNKVYLGRGVWADTTLYYQKGEFQTLPWTFPDFVDSQYYDALLQLRRNLKSKWRNGSSAFKE